MIVMTTKHRQKGAKTSLSICDFKVRLSEAWVATSESKPTGLAVKARVSCIGPRTSPNCALLQQPSFPEYNSIAPTPGFSSSQACQSPAKELLGMSYQFYRYAGTNLGTNVQCYHSPDRQLSLPTVLSILVQTTTTYFVSMRTIWQTPCSRSPSEALANVTMAEHSRCTPPAAMSMKSRSGHLSWLYNAARRI